MKYNCHITVNLAVLIILSFNKLYAQDSSKMCKVEMNSLIGTYSGECKNGYAHGKGEAKGLHRYVGIFSNGLPNGKGIYYYNDSIYYSGNFQDGIREGKGEMHYLRNGVPDSIVKGYWSADEYRGNRYITYDFPDNSLFDFVDIKAVDVTGNSITIIITTTSGSPKGIPNSISGGFGYVLTITELIATDGKMIKKMDSYTTNNRFFITYELSKFPIKLQAILSNGKTFDLELYKHATWTAHLYIHK